MKWSTRFALRRSDLRNMCPVQSWRIVFRSIEHVAPLKVPVKFVLKKKRQHPATIWITDEKIANHCIVQDCWSAAGDRSVGEHDREHLQLLWPRKTFQQQVGHGKSLGVFVDCMVISCNVPKNKMKPTNPNADTYVEKQRLNTYLSQFPANPFAEHHDVTHWGDTLVGHPCLTLLRYPLVRHSCMTLWFDTLAGHPCLTLF